MDASERKGRWFEIVKYSALQCREVHQSFPNAKPQQQRDEQAAKH